MGSVGLSPLRPTLFVLSTPNPSRMAQFYREVIGWSLQPVSGFPTAPPVGDETQVFIVREGAGGWLPFLAVPDLALTLDRARAAGGRVVHPLPDDASGRAASIFDPTGTRLGVCDVISSTPPAGPAAIGPGRVVWIEEKTRDQDAATSFLEAVFGFTAVGPTGPGAVRMLRADNGPTFGGVMQFDDRWAANHPPHWLAYVSGPVDETLKLAVEHGGSVWFEPTDTPLGRIAYLRDPAGNPLAVVDIAAAAAGLLLPPGAANRQDES